MSLLGDDSTYDLEQKRYAVLDYANWLADQEQYLADIFNELHDTWERGGLTCEVASSANMLSNVTWGVLRLGLGMFESMGIPGLPSMPSSPWKIRFSCAGGLVDPTNSSYPGDGSNLNGGLGGWWFPLVAAAGYAIRWAVAGYVATAVIDSFKGVPAEALVTRQKEMDLAIVLESTRQLALCISSVLPAGNTYTQQQRADAVDQCKGVANQVIQTAGQYKPDTNFLGLSIGMIVVLVGGFVAYTYLSHRPDAKRTTT